MFGRFSITLVVAIGLLFGGATTRASAGTEFSHFVGITNFTGFTCSHNERGETILVSPKIPAGISWNECIVSWNADAPAGSYLKMEACVFSGGQPTKFYALGNWSPDNKAFARSSVANQKDANGDAKTDTLVLTHSADAVQIRVTGGTNSTEPQLKFVGISFSNTKVQPTTLPPNKAAWGKIIVTPERTQHGYPDSTGWCSPASLSMVLARWADVLNRSEMNLTVPQTAGLVYDNAYHGAGNWVFNTALAGSFHGVRSYVTRLDDLAEVEDWIAADIPVILSARWDWLKPGRPTDANGHLVVCIGFTENGDVIVNDPAARVNRGETVRQIYKREDVLHAWMKSNHAVYLIYPTTAKIPVNRYGHW